MTAITTIFLIALGGSIGAVLRYFCMSGFGALFPSINGVYATASVNIIGSLLMGALIGLLAKYGGQYSSEIRLFVAVGVLGSFTTFSTFSLDVISMYQNGQLASAMIYVISSVILSILALFAGLLLIRTL